MIYASVYFTILYKDGQKLEKTRKHRKPMPHNQGVAGSCPAGTTKAPIDKRLLGLFVSLFNNYTDAGPIGKNDMTIDYLHSRIEIVGDEQVAVKITEVCHRRELGCS